MREFDGSGQPVRDLDFTSPTYPKGNPRPDHLPPPHQHSWIPMSDRCFILGDLRS